MSVRSDVASTPVPAPPTSRAAVSDRRVSILPPGERERRRSRPDRRRADRRQQDVAAPYGADRRSGHDDRQADRRARSNRPAGISLMRDYFSPGEAAAAPVPPPLVVRRHD